MSQTTNEPVFEPIYGFLVHCIFRDDEGNEIPKAFRSKGKSETKAKRTPIFKRGFVRIVSLEPFTEEQWIRALGEGRT